MTRETVKALLSNGIFEAFANGKTVQVRASSSKRWDDIEYPNFESPPENYRIKQEPREFWINPDTTRISVSRLEGTGFIHVREVTE